MAIDFIWLAPSINPSTGIRVNARCTTEDACEFSLVGGETISATPDLAGNDGVVTAEFVGLDADTEYTVDITQDGSSDRATFKTCPDRGAVTLGWCACIGQGRSHFASAFEMVDEWGVDLVFIQDDYPYNDLDLKGYGEAHVTVGTDPTDVANYWAGARYIRKVPGSRYLGRTRPYSFMWGDHNFCGEDWDNSIKSCAIPNKVGGVYAYLGNRLPTAEEVVGFWAAAMEGNRPYIETNPENTDEGVSAEAPPSADATGIANNGGAGVLYAPRYHRIRIGTLVEIFVLDPYSHCDEMETAASASKTLLGTVQKAWLKASLKASPCTFKLISCALKTFANDNDNSHIWAASGVVTITSAGQPDHPLTLTPLGYENERDELLAFIEDGTEWAVPGGVAWIAADRHCPSVHASDTYDHLCVVACPESNDVNENQGTSVPSTTLWLDAKFDGTYFSGGNNAYGIVQINDEQMDIKIVALGKRVLWQGTVLPGQNSVHYPDARMAVA